MNMNTHPELEYSIKKHFLLISVALNRVEPQNQEEKSNSDAVFKARDNLNGFFMIRFPNF